MNIYFHFQPLGTESLLHSQDFYQHCFSQAMENPLTNVHKGHSDFSSYLLPSRNRQLRCAMNIKIPCPTTTTSSSNHYYGRLRRQQPIITKQFWKNDKWWKLVPVNCAKGGGPLEKDIITEEELLGLRENCKEEAAANGGIAELLECLEREAIMGEDEGKAPTDYNRRAQIFHRSSRVFQALKESTNITTTTT